VIKHISIIYRPPNKTHEETVQYWKEVHNRVVKSRLPKLRKYVGNFPVQSPQSDVKQPGGGQQMQCDAIVELHFDTLEDLTAAMTGNAWLSDERKASSTRFMDYTRMTYVVMEEVVIPLDKN